MLSLQTLTLLSLLPLQAPLDGWGMVDAPAREVKTLYWELSQTTEVWVTLEPRTRDGAAPVRLAFQALFPGKAVKGAPSWLGVKALGSPFLLELTLRLVIDGKIFDLTGPEGSSVLLYPPCGAELCNANGVSARLESDLLLALASKPNAEIVALTFPLVLSSEDRAALRRFAERIGLMEARPRGQ